MQKYKIFEEYERLGDPSKSEKSKAWQVAIGLQQVDALEPSSYLLEIAKQNIDGNITFAEVIELINAYYKSQDGIVNDKNKEADLVSTRIAEIISTKTFSLSVIELISIHKKLFEDFYEFAGKIRKHSITKKEWVLDGDTVYYCDWEQLEETLIYDFAEEKKYIYTKQKIEEVIEHFTNFTSNIWQVHPFAEGNTRTVAVFIIKYLRFLGYKIDNTLFRDFSWYFRNALVRANFNDHSKQIVSNTIYLKKFFENLLIGTKHKLKNRYLNINFTQ